MIDWIMLHQNNDQIQRAFARKGFSKNISRCVEQSTYLFGLIHGMREYQAFVRFEFWQNRLLNNFVHRAHVIIQQLLTQVWTHFSHQERLTIAHLWSERLPDRREEWKKVVTGVNKASIATIALERCRGHWKVYLASFADDERESVDLIATGRGIPPWTDRVQTMGYVVQVKSGAEDAAVVMKVDEDLHDQHVLQKKREKMMRMIEVAENMSSPSRPFVPLDIIVGKTPTDVRVFDVEERAQRLALLMSTILRPSTRRASR